MKRASALVMLGVLLAACGCGGQSPTTPPNGDPTIPPPTGSPTGSPTDRATAVIDTSTGQVEFEVEIANSVEERRRGLMGRESLPERAGMLFVHQEDMDGGFWMKDTLVPLSIAFIDAEGRILEILDMEPCAADPCPLYRPGVRYRLALEVNRGAFSRSGVALGDVVRLAGS